MLRTLLNAKIHRATVTHCELQYEGSCAIDDLLLEASGIAPNEQVDIYNVSNGERFTTYALRALRGSGMISLNGAAARKAAVGDLVIIAAYAQFDTAEVATHQPTVVFVDANNRILERRGERLPLTV
jgi:aspartate 1-decarboxylase